MADAMFERILGKSDVFYRHQQNGEPDLTEEEKRTILDELLASNKALFLQRYGQHMVTDDCELFRSDSDPLVQFLVGQIESRKPDTRSMKTRRYLMLQKLKETGSYFFGRENEGAGALPLRCDGGEIRSGERSSEPTAVSIS